VKGRLRLGAWIVCLGLVGAGLYLALLSPGPAAFEKVEGRLHDISVVPVDTPAGPDRQHQLSITGAPCRDYDYLESWAVRANLPLITDLNTTEVLAVYTDHRACAGFNAGGSAPIRALVYQGRLYATDAYLHPRDERLANLPAAILLLLIGATGMVMLLRPRLGRGRRSPGAQDGDSA
jgi:hypothetical protein